LGISKTGQAIRAEFVFVLLVNNPVGEKLIATLGPHCTLDHIARAALKFVDV
jgi:hypothetical protein